MSSCTLLKKIKMLYESQRALDYQVKPGCTFTRNIHHYEFSGYHSNKNKEAPDILLRKQRKSLNIHYDTVCGENIP